MTKERRMEMSMVKAYGVVAMEDILEASRRKQLEEEANQERMINEIFLKPNFQDSLIKEAEDNSVPNCVPETPRFLEKYI